MAVSRRLRLGAFAEVPLPHPTRGEIYRRAAFAWLRRRPRRGESRRLGISVPRLIGLWFKLTSRL